MKKPIKAERELVNGMSKLFATYYSRCLSERIKRGIAAAKARKLSALANSSAV